MSNPLIPDYALDDIYAITPALLKGHGVKGILIDLDGTMASRKHPEPEERLVEWMGAMKKAGIAVLVLSNNNPVRVEKFCRKLEVPFLARATKPFQKGFVAGSKKLKLKAKHLAVIGDQIFTDTLGGNRFGALTIYVSSIDHAAPHIWLRFQLERYFVWQGRRRTRRREEERT